MRSAVWRIARAEELPRLWPAARTSHVARSLEELQELYAAAPWRVRVSSAGDAMVLVRWREHLDALAIRAAWTVPHRLPLLVDEARAVARAQGFASVVSPLVPASQWAAYEAADMCLLEEIVALQALSARVAVAGNSTPVTPRRAHHRDLTGLVDLDAQCFDTFWHYGRPELESALADERLTVVEEDGRLLGYASAAVRLGTCTLGRLCTAPAARRRGVGAALVHDVARWATEHDGTVFSLCTQADNAASRALYRSLGLREVEEPYALLVAT